MIFDNAAILSTKFVVEPYFLILVYCIASIQFSIAQRSTADCEQGRTSAELNINNVRAQIHSIGDMWWDLIGFQSYIIPADDDISPIYCGAIWIGGKDSNNQIKAATTRYRQNGVDFANGPLNDQGQTNIDVCRKYDKLWSITKQEVKEFRTWWECSNNPDCDSEILSTYTIPDIVLNWPAHGPEGGYDMYLAPFWDNNNDGQYNPYDGDFPYFEFPEDSITEDIDCLKPRDKKQTLKGDQSIWFVFNDAGKEHTNTGSESMGLEIRAQAYAYATNTGINNLTFYNYEIINRSTETLYEAYVGYWVDGGIGYSKDDYFGCDVQRGLGYIYNGDNYDETSEGENGYGHTPPAFGIDIFEGLYQDSDGLDNESSYQIIDGVKTLICSEGNIMNGNINGMNFQDGIVDNERWGATNIMWYSGAGTGVTPNVTYPYIAQDYYNYLKSYWKDSTPLLYGGMGYNHEGNELDTPTKFVFPGNPTTDICGYGQNGVVMNGWSEESENHSRGHRRYIISNGPVTFEPGAVNSITMGAVYGRANAGDQYESVKVMKRVDDIAQNLFDNCFNLLNGPDAPKMNIIELNNKLYFHIYNDPSSNNYLEQYVERDYNIKCDENISPCNENYKFQGYQVFQLKNPDVDITKEKNNPELVREVFQCDIDDDVTTIVNFNYDVNTDIHTQSIEVTGEDKGIVHTFTVNKDYFTGDTLVNQKDYWYTIVAYGYNSTMQFNMDNISNWHGIKEPYIMSRNNIKTYTALPHNPNIDNNGTIYNTDFDYSPQITMTEGHGNANQIIELTKESIEEIMSGYPWKISNRTYKNGMAPIEIKIIDPLNIPTDSYTLKFNSTETSPYGVIGVNNGSYLETSVGTHYSPFYYTITNSSGDSIISEAMIQYEDSNEQLFLDWGFSVSFSQQNFAGVNNLNNYQNGFLNAELIFENKDKPWLYFISDNDTFTPYNWIRSGTFYNREGEYSSCDADATYDDILIQDDSEYFEIVLGGTWAPYKLTSSVFHGLSIGDIRLAQSIDKKDPLSSVDLIITSDKSKWTRSCVVEMHDNEWEENECGYLTQVEPIENYLSFGNAHKFNLRKSPSVDKDGNPDDSGTHGMGWFPGYAIDHRTGERLNIIFGEDSWMTGENGSDMIWNPTSTLETTNDLIWGGKHVIYIMGNNQGTSNSLYNSPRYDSCQWIYNNLISYEENEEAIIYLRNAWTSAMWCAIPIQNPEFGLLDCDVTIKLRVATPYHQGKGEFEIDNPINNNYPVFKFSTHGLQAETSNSDVLSEALETINITPNPYYWGNHYGNYTYHDYVRIINLPQNAEIAIYNASGYLIRIISKSDGNSYYQWDLTDKNGNKIANGMYIIHVEVPGIGKKVLKWFGSSY